MDDSDITQQVMEIVLLLAPFLPYFKGWEKCCKKCF